MVADNQEKKLAVGDKIVDFGRVYRVFKISYQTGDSGEKKRIIHFRPYFERLSSQDLVCTIPEESLAETNIRRPLDPKEMRLVLKELTVPVSGQAMINFDQTRRIIADNNLAAIALLLKKIYYGRGGRVADFTISQKRTFSGLLGRVADEAALVLNKEPDELKKKIRQCLDRGLKGYSASLGENNSLPANG